MLSGILSQNESFLAGLNNIENRIAKTNQEITSGIRVNKASDDPGAVSSILSYQGQIDQITQVQSNLTVAASDASAADNALQTATTVLDNIASLGSEGLSQNQTASSRTILANQIQALQQQLVSIANASVGGKYIFGGDSSSIAPYTFDLSSPNGVISNGSAAATKVITDPNGSTRLSGLTASQIFDTRNPSSSSVVLTDAALAASPALNSTAHPGIAQTFTLTIQGQAAPLTVSVSGTPGGYTTQASLLSAVQGAINTALTGGSPALANGTITAGVDSNNQLQLKSTSGVAFTMVDNGADDTAHDSPAGITGTGSPSADNIFAAVASLSVALLSNNTDAMQSALTAVKAGVTHLESAGAFYGNVENWISAANTSASSQIASLTGTLATIKDTDLPTAATEMTLNNTALQAAIQAHASLSNKTLFDYIG